MFGSHDRLGGDAFCELDYEVWSAPVDDLGSWFSHGIAYSAKQDPGYSERKPFLFAPDVAQGNDGRFYLYYVAKMPTVSLQRRIRAWRPMKARRVWKIQLMRMIPKMRKYSLST